MHIGNIYIEETEERGRVCKVGGYENTLLGYMSRLYRELESRMNMDMIDVVMFGKYGDTLTIGLLSCYHTRSCDLHHGYGERVVFCSA